MTEENKMMVEHVKEKPLPDIRTEINKIRKEEHNEKVGEEEHDEMVRKMEHDEMVRKMEQDERIRKMEQDERVREVRQNERIGKLEQDANLTTVALGFIYGAAIGYVTYDIYDAMREGSRK